MENEPEYNPVERVDENDAKRVEPRFVLFVLFMVVLLGTSIWYSRWSNPPVLRTSPEVPECWLEPDLVCWRPSVHPITWGVISGTPYPAGVTLSITSSAPLPSGAVYTYQFQSKKKGD